MTDVERELAEETAWSTKPPPKLDAIRARSAASSTSTAASPASLWFTDRGGQEFAHGSRWGSVNVKMSALYRTADRGTADGLAAAGPGQTDEVGLYLTDEVFWYRVVDPVASEVGEMVELEDCYWLDVVFVPVKDIRARRLRVVSSVPVQG